MQPKVKVVIAGGTGFLGQGIIAQLPADRFEVHALSRHNYQAKPGDQTRYHRVDLNDRDSWLPIITDADWVVDAIGILLPNPFKKQNYNNSSYLPAKQLIDGLKVSGSRAQFLFISANDGPFFMRPYMKAKRVAEAYLKMTLPKQAHVVYPGVVYDKSRFSSYWLGLLLAKLTWIPYVKHLRPVRRADFAREVQQILENKGSRLEKRL